MEISATVRNANPVHEVVVRTDTAAKTLSIPPKASGRGSAVNGGELLMLALATCYCNDLYREAERLSIPIESVEVEASALFPAVGAAATGIRYRAKVSSPASASAIADLLRHTDAVSEVQNTIRAGVTVTLVTESRGEAS
jgi:organic hydroperoxide reductase OsmC/OhrA